MTTVRLDVSVTDRKSPLRVAYLVKAKKYNILVQAQHLYFLLRQFFLTYSCLVPAPRVHNNYVLAPLDRTVAYKFIFGDIRSARLEVEVKGQASHRRA